jgi:hypothetical protein
VDTADARGKGDAAAAQVQLKPWQNAYAPAEAKTHNESIVQQIGQYVPGFSHQANAGKCELVHPQLTRQTIWVTVSMCSSADMAFSTKI